MPHKDRDERRAYSLRWITERRNSWIADNGPCVKCGSGEQLEVDHIDPSLKTMKPSRLWSLALANPDRVAELKNCQVLCHNCHLKKTRGENQARFAGGRSSTASLTDEQAKKIKFRLDSGEKSNLLAKEYEVSKYTISRIKRGISYKRCGVEKLVSRLAHNQENTGAEPVAATIPPCSPMAEAAALKAVQCRFESDQGDQEEAIR